MASNNHHLRNSTQKWLRKELSAPFLPGRIPSQINSHWQPQEGWMTSQNSSPTSKAWRTSLPNRSALSTIKAQSLQKGRCTIPSLSGESPTMGSIALWSQSIFRRLAATKIFIWFQHCQLSLRILTQGRWMMPMMSEYAPLSKPRDQHALKQWTRRSWSSTNRNVSLPQKIKTRTMMKVNFKRTIQATISRARTAMVKTPTPMRTIKINKRDSQVSRRRSSTISRSLLRPTDSRSAKMSRKRSQKKKDSF